MVGTSGSDLTVSWGLDVSRVPDGAYEVQIIPANRKSLAHVQLLRKSSGDDWRWGETSLSKTCFPVKQQFLLRDAKNDLSLIHEANLTYEEAKKPIDLTFFASFWARDPQRRGGQAASSTVVQGIVLGKDHLSKIDSQAEELAELKITVAALQKKLCVNIPGNGKTDKLDTPIAPLQDLADHFSSKYDNLQQELRSLQGKEADYVRRKEMSDLLKDFGVVDNTVKGFEKQMESSSNALEDRIKGLGQEVMPRLCTLESRCDELERTIDTHKGKLEELPNFAEASKLSALEESLQELHASLDKEQKDSPAKLQEKLDQLEQDLKAHWEKAVQDKLDADLEAFKKALDTNLEQVKKDLEEGIDTAKTDADKAKGDTKALKDELNELGQALKTEQATLEKRLGGQLEGFKDTFKQEHDDTVKSLEEQLRILKEKLEEASEETFQGLEEAKQALQQEQEKTKTMENQISQLKADGQDIAAMNMRVNELQDEVDVLNDKMRSIDNQKQLGKSADSDSNGHAKEEKLKELASAVEDVNKRLQGLEEPIKKLQDDMDSLSKESRQNKANLSKLQKDGKGLSELKEQVRSLESRLKETKANGYPSSQTKSTSQPGEGPFELPADFFKNAEAKEKCRQILSGLKEFRRNNIDRDQRRMYLKSVYLQVHPDHAGSEDPEIRKELTDWWRIWVDDNKSWFIGDEA